jgi:hypothetical protein
MHALIRGSVLSVRTRARVLAHAGPCRTLRRWPKRSPSSSLSISRNVQRTSAAMAPTSCTRNKWAHPCPHLRRDSARPGPHLRRDSARPCPHLHRDWSPSPLVRHDRAHPRPHLRRDSGGLAPTARRGPRRTAASSLGRAWQSPAHSRVPAQMWAGCARSQRNCGRGEPQSRRRCCRGAPGPSADVGRGEPSPGADAEGRTCVPLLPIV